MKATWHASCQNSISIYFDSADLSFSHAAKDWNSSLPECLRIHDIQYTITLVSGTIWTIFANINTAYLVNGSLSIVLTHNTCKVL